MIAVSFALREESSLFVRKLYGARIVVPGHLPVIQGRLGGQEILVCHTGMGAHSVHHTLPGAIGPHRLRGVVATGFAGALDPALSVGDIVAASNVSTPALLEVALELGALPLRFVTVAEVVETKRDRRRTAAAHHADVVDMETDAIADLCRTRTLPFLAVRAISDSALRDFPVPGRILFDPLRQRPRPLALAAYLAVHPARLGPFARFVSDVSQARRRLTHFLERLLA